jgi:phenylpropionate dioxygenase-like ring-hydroxylating dioxygenase large terminal subunit
VLTETVTQQQQQQLQQEQQQHSQDSQPQSRQQRADAPEPFVWTRCWYPVSPVSYLDPSRPTPITLLGQQLVLWRDGGGAWRCFKDACPHRCEGVGATPAP